MNHKTTILYTIGCLLLFWLIIHWSKYIIRAKGCLREGLTDFEQYSQKIVPYPRDAVINFNDANSPLYSHNVNLPINDPVSCKNFCGPQSQCAITREQCSSDIDCYGCNPGPKPLSNCETKDVEPYDDAGKLGQNQGLQYSPLTTGYNNHNVNFSEIYPGSKNAQIKKPYQGANSWEKSFNQGLSFYNQKRESADKYSAGLSQAIPIAFQNNDPESLTPKYPTTISATGMFYETTPPAANATLQTALS
jgi:hypothetical protein